MSKQKHTLVSVIVTLCAATPLARGQAVLSSNSGGFATNPIGSALRDLEIPFTTVQTNQQTLDALRSQSWDLVIMRRQERFLPGFEADILAELEAHVAGGGRLHFQMADLEDVPEAWYDLLGLEGAVDLELPLSEILLAPPRHPIVRGGGAVAPSDEQFPPDYGDVLVPALHSTVVQLFSGDGSPSTTLSHSGRVVVNGPQWDNWNTIDAAFMVGGQVLWLLRCPADLDLDGAATLGDFLLFQNLFDRRDTVADVDGDGAWTVFDFLAFFNQFENGCR